MTPLLPPGKSNSLGSARGTYMQQAATQNNEWVPLTKESLTRAQQQGKPLLLVVGAAWSRDAREADEGAFNDPEVQNLIRKSFVSVRVDCTESPEWVNAYFPVSRAALGLRPGFQVYYVNPDGNLYDYLSPETTLTGSDPSVFEQDLVAARDSMKKGSQALNRLVQDINTLMAKPQPSSLNVSAQFGILQDAVDQKDGGFPVDGLQVLRPEAWRLQLMAGDMKGLSVSLVPPLKSPIFDWLDGGFFRASRSADWTDIEYDKIATSNAEIMEVLAQYAASTGDPFTKALAVRTFDSLVGEFLDGGSIRVARIGDEQPGGRSDRSSFAPKDLRPMFSTGAIPQADADWARTRLGLDSRLNPSMTIRISDPSILTKGKADFDRVMHELRVMKEGHKPEFVSSSYADVNGYVAARLLTCARLWSDAGRLQVALTLSDRLDSFRTGVEVRHRSDSAADIPELSDYLAYSDACLNDYLATGRVVSLNNGLNVLLEAKTRFELKTPGAWLPAKLPFALRNSIAPEIIDNVIESLTAREIHLMWAYSRLLEGSPSGQAASKRLSQGATDCVRQFMATAPTLGVAGCGFYCSALELSEDSYAVAVGPEAGSVADKLQRLAPTRLVAPAFGPVRADLQAREPGIYVVRKGSTSGPVDVATAAKMLSRGP